MGITTRLYTWLRGEKVGSDAFGNRYYRSRKARRDDGRRERRWVMFAGPPEASAIPPEWHAWLPYMVAEPPSVAPPKVQSWEREHLPNLTGTAQAYRPPGHDFRGGRRARATGDYEPWTPG